MSQTSPHQEVDDSLERWEPLDPRTAAPPPQRPKGSLRRRWWIVLVGAVLIGAATYAVSRVVPKTYASSADVVVLVTGGNDVNDTTLGANNLADQYAQLVDSSQVLTIANRLMNQSGSVPQDSITGSVVSAQNLISIQATARTPTLAKARATAVTIAFIKYITQQVSNQSSKYETTSTSQLRPLNQDIARTETQLNDATGGPTAAKTVALQQALDTLLAQRAAALANIASTAAAGRSTLQLASTAGDGSQIAPRPTLYAIIGFVLGLLILTRLVTYIPGPRGRGRAAEAVS